MWTLFSVSSLLLMTNVVTSSKVLLISMDGFRWDYIQNFSTPNFDEFAQNGVTSKQLTSAFITKTFPCHYTLATGNYFGHAFMTTIWKVFHSLSRQILCNEPVLVVLCSIINKISRFGNLFLITLKMYRKQHTYMYMHRQALRINVFRSVSPFMGYIKCNLTIWSLITNTS